MSLMSRTLVFLSLQVCLLFSWNAGVAANGQSTPPPPIPTYLQQATDGVHNLQAWYTASTGLYQTTGWWNSANAITLLVDYSRVSKSTLYLPAIANTFAAAQKTSPGFLNHFYDDEGWWALAWIDAYDVTKDARYLSMAKSIFVDMEGGWDDTCGGGVWWSKDKRYKAAIANELFLSVAAHLANRTSGAEQAPYLNWANKEWKWFLASGMVNSTNLINDGLDIGSTGSCTNNRKTTWTYNQGVVLGGLAELSKLNPDPSLPPTAHKIALAAITTLVDKNGILHDFACEPTCGADGVQFKGIFVRNLIVLNHAYPKAQYKTFVEKNATTIWEQSRGANYSFGQIWSGPFDAGNAGSQSSALDAIVGAADMQARK